MKKKILAKILAFVLCVVMVAPVLAACKYKTGLRFSKSGEYTYSTFMSGMPKTWNPHSYSISNEASLLEALYTPFYEYMIDPDAEEVTYTKGTKVILQAARDLPQPVELTSAQLEKYGLEKSEGHAWAIPLNADLKWNDGTPITAQDFVDSMKLLIDPARKNRNGTGYFTKAHTSELANAYDYYWPRTVGSPDDVSLYTGGLWTPNEPSGVARYFSVTRNHDYITAAVNQGFGTAGAWSLKTFLLDFWGMEGDAKSTAETVASLTLAIETLKADGSFDDAVAALTASKEGKTDDEKKVIDAAIKIVESNKAVVELVETAFATSETFEAAVTALTASKEGKTDDEKKVIDSAIAFVKAIIKAESATAEGGEPAIVVSEYDVFARAVKELELDLVDETKYLDVCDTTIAALARLEAAEDEETKSFSIEGIENATLAADAKIVGNALIYCLRMAGVPVADDTNYETTMWTIFAYDWDGETLVTETTWDDVGIYADEEENALVFVYTLTRQQMDVVRGQSSSFLVYNEKYVELTTTVEGLVSTKYNTNKATTYSWGPYTMTNFQVDKEIILSRNPHFPLFATPDKIVPDKDLNEAEGVFDHSGKTYAEKYKNLYQSTRIYYTIVSNYDVGKTLFDKGLVDSVGITPEEAEKYERYPENWRQAVIGQMWGFLITTQLDKLEAIQASADNDSENILILSIPEFREALSRAMDRKSLLSDYSMGSRPLYTYTSELLMLRELYSDNIFVTTSEQYKNMIVELLNLGDKIGAGKTYATKEEAIAATTGFDLAYAKTLMQTAYDKAIEAGIYEAGKNIKINCYVPSNTSTFDAVSALEYAELEAMMEAATIGTPLQGKVNIVIRPSPSAANHYEDLESLKMEMGLYGTGISTTALNELLFYSDWKNPSGIARGLDVLDDLITVTTLNSYSLKGSALAVHEDLLDEGVPKRVKHPRELGAGTHTLRLEEWLEIYSELHMEYLKKDDPKNLGVEGLANLENDMLSIFTGVQLHVLKNAGYLPYYDASATTMYSHKVTSVVMADGTSNLEYNKDAGFGTGFLQRVYLYDDAEWEAFVAKNKGKIY